MPSESEDYKNLQIDVIKEISTDLKKSEYSAEN
jgi:hypothetical protein